MADRRFKECDCPAWVSRCVHLGGRRVWLALSKDVLAEYRERTGEDWSGICAECGAILQPVGSRVAAVLGPGRVASEGPDCACKAGMLMDDIARFKAADTMEEAEEFFSAAVDLMAAT